MPYYFIVPLLSVISAQLIKTALMVHNTGEFKFDYFLKHGRMPSAHTALVTSLMTVMYWHDGIASSTFAISAVIAFIVIDDAIRFRFYLGQQAKTLNRLVKDTLPPEKASTYSRLHETLGHYPIEALAGAFYGILFSIVLIKLIY